MPTDTPAKVTVTAVRDLSRKKVVAPSGFAASGDLRVDRRTQVRRTMSFANLVATNVHLDDLNDLLKMNKTYAQYFPARHRRVALYSRSLP